MPPRAVQEIVRTPNLPMTYVERETGKGYWEAVIEDGAESEER